MEATPPQQFGMTDGQTRSAGRVYAWPYAICRARVRDETKIKEIQGKKTGIGWRIAGAIGRWRQVRVSGEVGGFGEGL